MNDAGPTDQGLEELRTMFSDKDPTRHFVLGAALRSWPGWHKASVRSTGASVRIKRVWTSRMKFIANEVRTLKEMRERKAANILQYRDACMHGAEVWIVTEDLEGCSLRTLYRKHKLDEMHIAYITRETCQGIRDLHRRDIIHHDIRSDNIFITNEGHVKIINFELSTPPNTRHQMVGTPHWMAPEMIRQEPYCEKIDIWALGIVVIEMFELDPPYGDEDSVRTLYLIVINGTPTLRFPDLRSSALKSFLSVCVCVNVPSRSTAAELLKVTTTSPSIVMDFANERKQHKYLKQACSPSAFVELLGSETA